MIRILESKQVGRLLARKAARLTEAEEVVRPILDALRKRGDRALLEYARQFDGLDRKTVRVPESELRAAEVSAGFSAAVQTASANIRAYAERQMPKEWSAQIKPGVQLGQLVRPLDTVAAYIPSGRYPLPSTVMMTVIPAQVAGVPNVCVASPKAVPEVFATANLLGVNQVFQMGGAQAIAAFAFGTRTVPRADRIVGPGNIYVAAAKKLLAGEVGIDFIAGPTEILIIAAEGDPRHFAADMLAQAEHDVDASAVLLTPSKRLAAAVAQEIERQLAVLPTAKVAAKSIAKNSAIVLVESLEEAVEISNRFAPEHLSIPNDSLLSQVRHAGSVFVGPFSPEAAGDYASGPNHVLPTSGAARQRGGLSVMDYVKLISVQELSEVALTKLAPAITTLARAEGLEAHARSVEARTFAMKGLIQPRPAVIAMAPYHPPTAGRAGKLRLDFNENTVGCSPRVIEAITRQIAPPDLAVYPEYGGAREDIARYFGVGPEEFLFTNGTDEAIQVFINTYVDDGQEVLVLKPAYAMYRFYAEVAGAKVVEVEYPQPEMEFPLQQLLDVITPETRAVIISNPNNPTGTGLSLVGIGRILARAKHAAVLVDEAYYEFSGVTAIRDIARTPNLFVTRTFSKVFGMAGLRLGCLFSHAANIEFLHKAQSPYSVNSLAVLAAQAAVEDSTYVQNYVAEVLAARELLCYGLETLGIRYVPSSANFVLGHFGSRATEVRDRLRDQAILVRDRSYEAPGCVRITVGTREQTRRLLDALEEIWNHE